MDEFVHLHTHSDHSLLDGAQKVKAMVHAVAALGQPAIALTDHGSLSGAFELYKECKLLEIKPIIGSELYVSPGPRVSKERAHWGDIDEGGRARPQPGAYTHLTVLARTAQGLRNLYQLQGQGYLTGFHSKPRVDRALLAEYSEGLVVLSGCMGSEISTRLRLGQDFEALEAADFYRQTFREHFYVEMMDHGTTEDARLNKKLFQLSDECGAPIVATNDSHYTRREDHVVHEAFLCLQSKTDLHDSTAWFRSAFQNPEFYLKSRAQMATAFEEHCLVSSLAIAESVEDYAEVFQKGHFMPPGDHFELAENSANGLLQRGIDGEGYRERLGYELGIIRSLDFSGYFLVLADVIGYAKSKGILIGPCRGSAGGSLTAYALGITDIDPIRYGLVFERFLNPTRVSPPDIDFDIQEDRRDELVQYAVQKYGSDCVAQILTVGTEKTRSAVRDAAKVLGRDFKESQGLVKMVPSDFRGRGVTLSEVPEIGQVDAEVYDLALGLEGLIRQRSTHPAGVVISPVPLSSSIPTIKGPSDSQLLTGYQAPELEALGYVKFDFLGLSNLTTIVRTLEMINATPS